MNLPDALPGREALSEATDEAAAWLVFGFAFWGLVSFGTALGRNVDQHGAIDTAIGGGTLLLLTLAIGGLALFAFDELDERLGDGEEADRA